MKLNTQLRKNKVALAILLFMFFYGILITVKPPFAYNSDGSIKPFGVGYKNKTVIPVWLISIILGILCYYAVMVYFTFS